MRTGRNTGDTPPKWLEESRSLGYAHWPEQCALYLID